MRQRTASRLAWTLATLSVALANTGLVLAAVAPGGEGVAVVPLYALPVSSIPIVGALIASRRRENPIGWVLLAAGVATAIQIFSFGYGEIGFRATRVLPGAVVVSWLGDVVWFPAVALSTTLLFLLFPHGRLPSRRWRPVFLVAVVGAVLTTLSVLFEPTLYAHPDVAAPLAGIVPESLLEAPGGLGFLAVVGATLASVVSLLVRFRRSVGEERQQSKWLLYAAVLTLAVEGPLITLELNGWFYDVLGAVATMAVPVAVAIAILRFRLYDIDVVIRKSVVVAILGAFVTIAYLVVVVGIPVLFLGVEQGRGLQSVLPFAAAAVLAIAFQPARAWARRLADRLVYGKRATPYEVLSEFSERVGGAYGADDVLPRMARIVGEGTGAARAEIWLRVGNEIRRSATWPHQDDPVTLPLADGQLPSLEGADRAYPVRHRGELLGALAVAKPAVDRLTPVEEKLLADLASQAGLILRNVRLIEELRASRQRLVAAQDQERGRLERNIHDGAQQELVALAVKLRVAEAMVRRDPDKAESLLQEVRAETQEALENLRDLARGIYPPLLADRGLVAALEAQARKSPLDVTVGVDSLDRYPQEVEAAVYFCILEAMQNAAKYSEASRATIRLGDVDGELRFEVVDEGRGFDPERTPPGSGLTNMRDRMDALAGNLEVRSRPGAGTSVLGRVPVPGRRSAAHREPAPA